MMGIGFGVKQSMGGTAVPPVLTLSAGPLAYNQAELQKVIDGALTVTDSDSTNLASATIQITSGIQTGDILIFAGHGGIPAGVWDDVDTLTITGTASKATWEAALRLVKFQNELLTAATTGTRTLTWVVSDGVNESDPETIDIDVSDAATPADPEIADVFVVYKMTYDGTGNNYYRKNTYSGNVTCDDPVGRFQFQGRRYQMDGTDDAAAWANPVEYAGADGAFEFDAQTSVNGTADQEIASPGAPVLMRVRADAWGQVSNWVESDLMHVFCVAPVPVVDWETGSLSFSATGATRFFLGTSQASYAEVTSPQTGLSNGTYYLAGANADPTGAGLFTGSDGTAGLDNPARTPTLILEPPAAATGFTPTLELADGINCTWTPGARYGNATLQARGPVDFVANYTIQTYVQNVDIVNGIPYPGFAVVAVNGLAIHELDRDGTNQLSALLAFPVGTLIAYVSEDGSVGRAYQTTSNATTLTGTSPTRYFAKFEIVELLSWGAGFPNVGTPGTPNDTVSLRASFTSAGSAVGPWQNIETLVTSPFMADNASLATIGAGDIDLRVLSLNHWGSTPSSSANVTIGLGGNITGMTATTNVSPTWDWDDDAFAASWKVRYRRKHLAGDDSYTDDVAATSTYTLTTPAAGRYDLQALATNFLGDGNYSAPFEAATSVPNAITGLTITNDFPRITITWDPDADDLVDTWKIERSPTGAGTYTVLSSSLTSPTYTDSPGGEGPWDYRVTGINVAGAGTPAVDTSDALFLEFTASGSVSLSASCTAVVRVWGGGGGGADDGTAANGGGGAAVAYSTLSLSATSYSFTIGDGGAAGVASDGSAGGTSSWNGGEISAVGGDGGLVGGGGGAGGDAASCVGDNAYSGGAGSFIGAGLGGGGGAAGAGGNGGNSPGQFGGAGNGGGGNGGDAGSPGVAPGGGGGTSAAGARGGITIRFS